MIFIDTGAFFGRYVVKDQHHAAATRKWQAIQEAGDQCFTSQFVLNEAAFLLARKTDYQFAVARMRAIYNSASLTILRSDEQGELQALDWMEKFADQQVSFTDCLSFVLMERHSLRRVFTFDRHFALAGFDVEP